MCHGQTRLLLRRESTSGRGQSSYSRHASFHAPLKRHIWASPCRQWQDQMERTAKPLRQTVDRPRQSPPVRPPCHQPVAGCPRDHLERSAGRAHHSRVYRLQPKSAEPDPRLHPKTDPVPARLKVLQSLPRKSGYHGRVRHRSWNFFPGAAVCDKVRGFINPSNGLFQIF